MLLMGMDKASSTTGGGENITVLAGDVSRKKTDALPIINQRSHQTKHLFTQSYREPSNLTKKPHHGSGTFTMSTELSPGPAGKSGIPILVDRPKFTRGPNQLHPMTKSEAGAGISRNNRGQSWYEGSRQKQRQPNIHEMHVHPKQRTGSYHHTPSKFPSLPQISGESRIPVPRLAPPVLSSKLPVVTRTNQMATSPGSEDVKTVKTSRLAPSIPRGAKFHRSESLRVESSHGDQDSADAVDTSRTRRSAHGASAHGGYRLPISPHHALKEFGHKLSAYEHKEIMEYPEVWFLGIDAKKVEGTLGSAQNAGFDDDNGSYVKVLHDHIAYRYEIREVIGKGSFGQVVKCFDHKTNQPMAIKIIRNKKRFHHQALVEVKILDSLRKKDRENQYNIIHMIDYFYFRNHLCITFELMGINLYELIKKNNFQGFSIALIRRFAYALLQCLKLLARERIIHCDLKPENILLKLRGQSQIKVIDFGSSCYDHQRIYTYIQSRFYRSPEVILGLPYSMAIDMWSFGAILAELYTGYPLFPGENEAEQLSCIMEIFDTPSASILAEAQRKKLFFDSKNNPKHLTNSKGRRRRPGSKELASAVKTNDENFLSFLSRCLEWDPAQRITPEEALQHEWILEGRSRGISRVLPLAVTSSASRGAHGPSPTHNPSHYNGHTDSASSSKHSSSVYESSRRRLQPIGADTSKTRSSDKVLNGLKRSSLVLEPGSKDTAKQGMAKQTSQEAEGKKSSSSSDQSSKDAPLTAAAAAGPKLLPRLV